MGTRYTITDSKKEIIISQDFSSVEHVTCAARGVAERLLKRMSHDKDSTVYVNVYEGIKRDRDNFRFSVSAEVVTHISYSGPK